MPPENAAQAKENWAHYIRRIALGDEDALMGLYDESGSFVHSMVMRILGNPADAEEITADVFTQVWRRADTFDTEKGNAAAWLSMLAKSRAIDRYRSRLSRDQREEIGHTPVLDILDSAPAPETRVILQQRKKVVREAMEGLRPDQKEALEMSFFFGYTHSEVARKLGVPLGTIKSRVRTGMQNLRERLAPLIESEGGRS